MPADKAKKIATPKTTAVAATKAKPVTHPVAQEPQPERQSQFATILIGLLIIASGLLIYNYFQSTNQPATTTSTKQANQKATSTPTTPVPTPTKQVAATEGRYTVQAGDSLWSVSAKVYGDGNSWYKIAQANTLAKDSKGRPVVVAGQVLVVPDSAASTSSNSSLSASVTPTPTTNTSTHGSLSASVTPTPTANSSTSTSSGSTSSASSSGTNISETPNTAVTIYTVKPGDSLWSIAEATYGQGSDWTIIFNDSHNHLGLLPNGRPLIHAGNQLYLPAP